MDLQNLPIRGTLGQGSRHYHQYSFGSRFDLTTFFFYVVLHAQSEKNIFRSWQKYEVENFAHFEKDAFIQKNGLFAVFRAFRSEGSIHYR